MSVAFTTPVLLPLHQSQFHRQISCARRPTTMCIRRSSPVIVSDVLDTLVEDPFFKDMAQYFGFPTFNKFVQAKTPDVWVQFELGYISEAQLSRSFFLDGSQLHLEHFKQYLCRSYKLLPGIEQLLVSLRDAHIPVHLCTNYPVWADLIEESLHLSDRFGVKWTFVSGREGVRKPDEEAYRRTALMADVDMSSCIMLDDRQTNCVGALNAGYAHAVHFKDSVQATKELQQVLSQCDVSVNLDAISNTY